MTDSEEQLHHRKTPRRGAIPTPRSALVGASQHVLIAGAPAPPPNFIARPNQISTWGNVGDPPIGHGDCVTAEEAFAKGCGNPQIFISDDEVIRWATQHGVLEGANFIPVLNWMQTGGFQQDAQLYNDGPHYSVNWTNASILQSAISKGPVKIGVAANQLESAWDSTAGQTGWFATGFQPDHAEDHCVSLCGYGTISWLASQLGVAVPDGIDGTKQGYALFTWGTIGIIDTASMIAITHEAWLRQPTTAVKPMAGASALSPATAHKLRALMDQSIAAGDVGLAGAAASGKDFCSVWPTAKPVLQLLVGIVGLIPGLGAGAGAALNALITAGQAVYDQTCGSGH